MVQHANFKFYRLYFLAAATLIYTTTASAQTELIGLENLFTNPKSYVVHHTDERISIDGKLQETAWQNAEWTSDFADIEGDKKPLPKLITRAKMLWNDSTLFIAAQIQEPKLWATQTHHDDVIFLDNDFEVFINPDNSTHRYFEIEINNINKTFDLFLPKPYRNGGDALVSWDVPGLKTAVTLQGTLNNPADKDEGWTVEMAIPLKSLSMGYYTKTPDEGALWRINFSRVEWDTEVINEKYSKLKDKNGHNLAENNWVWSPQGVIDMHFPERWGYLLFTRKNDRQFILPYAEQQKKYLWLVYYREKMFFDQHQKYAKALAELGFEADFVIDNKANKLILEATDHQFRVFVSTAGMDQITINDEGLIQITKQ
jgi:hypothetical protein